MRPLKTNQRILTWLCLHPANNDTSKLTVCAYWISALATLSALVIVLVASSTFFWKYITDDIKQSLPAISQAFVVFDAAYTLIVLHFA